MSENAPNENKDHNKNTPDDAGDKGNAGGGASTYRPKGVPDHLVGKSDQETIDLMFKAYDGARETLSKQGKSQVPEKLDDYKIEFPKDVADKILKPDKDGKDTFFESMREVLHTEGIPVEKAVSLITKFYGKLGELQAAQNANVPEADFEFKNMGGADKAKPIIDGVISRLKGMQQTNKLSEADVNELTFLTAYSEGVTALQKMLVLAGEKPIPANLNRNAGQANEITKEILDRRVADPRYRKGSPSFDSAFYDETSRLFKEFYNENAA